MSCGGNTMKVLTNISLIIWILFGLVSIAASIMLVRTMVIFAAWLMEPEEAFEITNVLREWC